METVKAFSYNTKKLIFTRRTTYNPDVGRFPHHSHAQLEIVFCVGGGHGYIVDGRTVSLRGGDVIAIAPGVPHRVLVGEDDYERYSVIIHPAFLPQGALEEFKSSYILKKLTQEDRIYRLFKKAERYHAELPAEAQTIILPALALEIYYMLVRGEGTEGVTPSELVNRALEYIDENYADIKSISEISDSLYISKSYFHALFKEHMQKTPHAYLSERRLHTARVRILSGERPTKVYRECGFEDYTSFFRSYKAHYGTSPNDTSLTENDADGF